MHILYNQYWHDNFCSFNSICNFNVHKPKASHNMRLYRIMGDWVPTRVYRNHVDKGVGFPRWQPMSIRASIWNGQSFHDWATRGGKDKVDWSKGTNLHCNISKLQDWLMLVFGEETLDFLGLQAQLIGATKKDSTH